ncbi:hypothetical protein LBMAG33_6970 [Candidatus Levyibacteriota bacterium]|nr:hypothetical protein LBMAG33_6970 [Candidatus Levybacteria bacterium]
MDKDKRLQKIPKYSIDKIGAKSDLATRGLRELGLLKDEKHFTIIYVCQFCGRLINYSSTPCIFCGDYPKTKREVLVAQALSSNSLEMAHLLAVSKAVKNKEDLEIIIANLRHLVDDVLENENKYPHYKIFFLLANDLRENDDALKDKTIEQIKRSGVLCKKCGQPIHMADLPCLYCSVHAKRDGKNIETIKLMSNNLSETEKWTVALNNFLLFVENHLDMGENEKALDELIFVSVYIINRLIEKTELPEPDLKSHWKDLLHKAHYFGSYAIKGAVEIKSNKVDMEVEPERTPEEEFAIMSLGSNLAYLLKS